MSTNRVNAFTGRAGCIPLTGMLMLFASLTGLASPTLLDRSPFVPADFNPGAQNIASTPAATATSGYEFRGVYQIGDRYWFLVSDPTSQDGSWIELGKNTEDLLARSFDPETRSLVLVSNNTEHRLELASVEANPTPIPVKGLVKTTTRTPTKAPTPVRRTIRPTVSSQNNNSAAGNNNAKAAPAPAWLEKLRAEAAERRARAQQDTNAQSANMRRSITPNRPSQQTADSRSDPARIKPSRAAQQSR